MWLHLRQRGLRAVITCLNPLAPSMQWRSLGHNGRVMVTRRAREGVMSRINTIERDTTNETIRRNFDNIEKQLGVVPNMMRTMAQSPSVLEAYLGFGAALRRGRLSPRRGAVTDQRLEHVRAAGFSDAEIAEIIAHVGLNVFTNYFNRAAETEIDFPRVAAGQLV